MTAALKKLEVTFFNTAIDAATSATQERFSTVENVREKFWLLTHFQSLQVEDLTEQSVTLSTTLHFKWQSDLGDRELAQELKNLPNLPSKTMSWRWGSSRASCKLGQPLCILPLYQVPRSLRGQVMLTDQIGDCIWFFQVSCYTRGCRVDVLWKENWSSTSWTGGPQDLQSYLNYFKGCCLVCR